jgi:hypothetical protein
VDVGEWWIGRTELGSMVEGRKPFLFADQYLVAGSSSVPKVRNMVYRKPWTIWSKKSDRCEGKVSFVRTARPSIHLLFLPLVHEENREKNDLC